MNHIFKTSFMICILSMTGCKDNSSAKTQAAIKLFQLYDKIKDQGHIIPEEFGCTEKELEIFSKHYKKPFTKDLIEFLCETLPKSSLDIGVYKTESPKDLLNEQLNAVPFEGNMKYNLFGLGLWTGESDGDGWFYDLETRKVHAIQLYYNDEKSKKDVLEKAYHSFNSLEKWIDFLEKESKRRGLIP